MATRKSTTTTRTEGDRVDSAAVAKAAPRKGRAPRTCKELVFDPEVGTTLKVGKRDQPDVVITNSERSKSVTASADVAELRRKIKKARDYRWVVAGGKGGNGPVNEEKVAELDARVADLKAQLDIATGRQGGPTFVVTINPADGMIVNSVFAEDAAATRKVAKAARSEGLFVAIVPKA
jgi:hypothetical protein